MTMKYYIQQTSILDKKKVACENNYLIFIISLIIMCLLLLAVISISFYCYYTMHYLRNENVCHFGSRNEGCYVLLC